MPPNLLPVRRVVPAVERGGDEQALHGRLEAVGTVEVHVLEQVRDSEDDLEEEHSFRRNTERDDGREPRGKSEEELSRVEANGGRDAGSARLGRERRSSARPASWRWRRARGRSPSGARCGMHVERGSSEGPAQEVFR